MNETSHIWYKFGVRAKQLLLDLAKVDAEEFDVREFQYLQGAAETAMENLEEELREHLRNNPDGTTDAIE